MKKILITISLASTVMLLIFPFIIYYGNSVMIVTSDSMIPTLKPNDLLIVQGTAVDKIAVGDIIAFDSHIEEIGVVVHRVIAKFDDDGSIAIRTQGDNVNEADTWTIHNEDLIGKVTETVPSIGILLVEPVRYTLVVVIIIIAVSLLKEIISEIKLQKTNNSTNLY